MPNTENGGNIIERRPAEAATPVGLGVGYLIALAIGQDDNAQFMLAVAGVVAFIPTTVTFLVNLARK